MTQSGNPLANHIRGADAVYVASMSKESNLSILKPLWSRRPDGRWSIHAAKAIVLKPNNGCESDFFTFESDLELMTTTPPKNLSDLFDSFGPTDFLLKQSILPVVAWEERADTVRCISGIRDEVLLTATAQNLRRLVKLLSRAPPPFVAACPA